MQLSSKGLLLALLGAVWVQSASAVIYTVPPVINGVNWSFVIFAVSLTCLVAAGAFIAATWWSTGHKTNTMSSASMMQKFG